MNASAVHLRILFPAETDRLIAIGDLPDPLNPSRHLSFSTVYRWAAIGRNGVKLPVVRVGRKLATTQTALMEFLSESTCVAPPAPKPEIETPSQRVASDRLAAMGL